MNCKLGDMAFIVKSETGNEMKIVTVLSAAGNNPVFDGYIWFTDVGFCWMIECPTGLVDRYGVKFTNGPFPDAWLKPLPPLSDDESTDTITDLDMTIKEVA